MEKLTDIRAIRELLARHGFRFSKSLGQNFIVNPAVCPRMAEEGGAGPQVGALEIGAGIGVLTVELAKRCKKVVCVELDRRLEPVLGETLAGFDNITMVYGDVLKLDLNGLIRQEFEGMEVVICANLPYYITSPVVMGILEQQLPVRSVTVMVQREAAQRITSPMPSRQAGAITAAVAYYSKPRQLFSVSRGSFLPAPNVDSAVIRLDLLRTPPVPVEDEASFFQVVRGAFAQRRKTLLNTLSSSLGVEKEDMRQILEAAEVDPGSRAEQLSLEEFARVAGRYAKS